MSIAVNRTVSRKARRIWQRLAPCCKYAMALTLPGLFSCFCRKLYDIANFKDFYIPAPGC